MALLPHDMTRFLLRCRHDSDHLSATPRSERLRHLDPSQGCQEPDVSPCFTIRPDREDWSNISARGRYGPQWYSVQQAERPRPGVVRFHLLVFLARYLVLEIVVGPRWSMPGASTAACVRVSVFRSLGGSCFEVGAVGF